MRGKRYNKQKTKQQQKDTFNSCDTLKNQGQCYMLEVQLAFYMLMQT